MIDVQKARVLIQDLGATLTRPCPECWGGWFADEDGYLGGLHESGCPRRDDEAPGSSAQ